MFGLTFLPYDIKYQSRMTNRIIHRAESPYSNNKDRPPQTQARRKPHIPLRNMAQNVPLMDAQHPSRTQLAGLAAAGSLRSIIRGNAHSRLWADPMVWTEEHLRLIDCVLISSPAPAAFRSHEPTASCYAAAVRVHASLDRLTEPCFKDRKICELLQVLMECNPNFDVRTR